MAPVTFSPYLIRRYRSQLNGWLEANGLDPLDVPDSHPLRGEEGEKGAVIRYRAYVRDADGRLQSDPNDPNEVWTEERTAPCIVPPPDLDYPDAQPGG